MHPFFLLSNDDDPVCEVDIQLSCNNVIVFSAGLFIGIIISIASFKCYDYSCLSTIQINQPFKVGNSSSKEHQCQENGNDDDDGSLQVLQGALRLIEQYSSIAEKKRRKVVEFLSPEQVLYKFTNSSDESFSLDQKVKGVDHFLQLLRQIQRYSVDTSHKLFFNQLFGTVDPVAMAAEMIATCCNTCVYTFETAPIFTMMERHLIQKMTQLLYNHNTTTTDIDNKPSSPSGFGLFLPGGSISNMTALHVARYHILNKLQKQQQQQSQDQQSNNTNSVSRIEMDDRVDNDDDDEEKKNDDGLDDISDGKMICHKAIYNMQNRFVAFVSDEAHYSFVKSMNVLGFHPKENLVLIPTSDNGQMNVQELEKAINHVTNVEQKIPFFVGITAGSTVRGSFDDITAVVNLCKSKNIWVHVDGAWGGAALFSTRYRNLLLKDVHRVDSFTFNPHKLLGAPQQTTILLTKHKVNSITFFFFELTTRLGISKSNHIILGLIQI